MPCPLSSPEHRDKRQQLTILNTMMKNGTHWDEKLAQSLDWEAYSLGNTPSWRLQRHPLLGE